MSLPAARSALFSNSVFIFLTRFLPSLANLGVLVLYSRGLSQEAYGHYQYFWIQLNVIYPFICLGVHALIVAYPRALLVGLLRKIPASRWAMYLLWMIALAGVFAWLQARNGLLLFLPFLFIAVHSAGIIAESFLVVCRSYKELVVSNLLYATMFVEIHYSVLRDGFDLNRLFLQLLLLGGARLLVYGVFVVRELRTAVADMPETMQVNEIVGFWRHMGFYDISQVLFNWIDKFVVSLVLAASLSAIYFNGSMSIPFLPLLLSAAGSSVLMQLADTDKGSDKEHIVAYMNYVGRMLSCVVFPLFFFLLLFREELFVTLLTAKYAAAVPVFAASILVLPLRAYSFTTVLQRYHQGRIINAGAIGDLIIACGLMYPLYRLMGLPGIALSFVISTYIQSAYYLFHAGKVVGCSPAALLPYGNWLGKLIVFAFIFIIIHYVAVRFFSPMFGIIAGGALMIMMIGGSLATEQIMYKKHHGNK